MDIKYCLSFLIFFSCLIPPSKTVAELESGQISTKTNAESDVGEEDILTTLLNEFLECEIWILYDSETQIESFQWILRTPTPVYLISLNGNSSVPQKRNMKRFTQSSCSLILTFCRPQQSYKNINGLPEKLSRINRALLSRRKMMVFLGTVVRASAKMRTLIPEVAEGRSVFFLGSPLLQDINSTFATLGAHITLVQKWNNPNRQHRSRKAYHLDTWTPNWVPGGTPMLFDTWTKSEGFHFKNQLNIDVTHIKPNASWQFCIPSFIMRPLFEPSQRSTFGLAGIQADFIKEFAAKLQLNVSMIEAKEKEYGKKLPSGDWKGAIGSVIRKESDVAAGHLIFNAERRKAEVLFGPWDSVLSGAVVCSAPLPLPIGLRLFKPLEPDVWAYVVSTFFATLLFAKLVEKFIRKFLRPVLIWSDDWYAPPRVKMESVKWHTVLRPLLSQSIPDENVPRRAAFLILLGSWLLLSYLVTIYFKSGLVGFLLTIPVEADLVSVVDLVGRGDDPWFLTPLVEETIANSSYDVEQQLIQAQSKLEFSTTDQTMDLEMEGYLYLRNTVDNCLIAEEIRSKFYLPYFLSLGGTPELYVAEVPFFLGASGWFLRDDMDFTLQIFMSKFAAIYQTTGLFGKSLLDFQNGIPEYEHYEKLVNQPELHPLNLSHLKIVFLVYIISLTFACVVFVSEIILGYSTEIR